MLSSTGQQAPGILPGDQDVEVPSSGDGRKQFVTGNFSQLASVKNLGIAEIHLP